MTTVEESIRQDRVVCARTVPRTVPLILLVLALPLFGGREAPLW
jgi:hypothetical protein